MPYAALPVWAKIVVPILTLLAAILLLATVLRPVRRLVVHCTRVLLNGKHPLRWLAGLLFGMAPPLLWTLAFKQARRIPDHIRPTVHPHRRAPRPRGQDALHPGIIVSTLALLPLALVLHARARQSGGPGAMAWPAAVLLYPLALRILNELALGIDPAPALDVLAWIFYGVLHFASPFLVGWWLWFFAPPSAANVFGWCLGLQNLTGLLLHLLNPHAAPWYYDTYPPGTVPDYTFPGNAAGLVRVDKVLGTHLYTDGFRKGPVVFGAIPSLHAATAVCSSLFIARYCARVGTVLMGLYTALMFHSTMYFHHHWAIDLAAGSALTLLFFSAAALGPLRKIEYDHYTNLTTRGIDRLLNRTRPPASSVSLWHGADSAHRGPPPLFPLPCLGARSAGQHGQWQALPTEIPLGDVPGADQLDGHLPAEEEEDKPILAPSLPKSEQRYEQLTCARRSSDTSGSSGRTLV